MHHEYISKIDGTLNHVYDDGSEFRLVRRSDHDTLYLSSHTGCALACKQCHLTSTGQTRMVSLSGGEMRERADRLHRVSQSKHINFSFMARGDALASPHVNGVLVASLLNMRAREQTARVTISTIFPKAFVGDDIASFLFDRFGAFQPQLYWSLYSLNADFLAPWMPEAQDPEIVAKGLVAWQQSTFTDVVIHRPLIAGENDDRSTGEELADFLDLHQLRYRMNLVRYNPPDETSREASDAAYARELSLFSRATDGRVKLQPRVGFDVAASCGMFMTGETKTGEVQ